MSSEVLVFGAGVIGSIYAMRFAKAGFAVAVLARGERLEALRSGGLRIRNVFLDETEEATVGVISGLQPGTDWDLILVAVRSGQVTDALKALADARQAGPVLVVGNNLGPYEAEAEIAGADRLVLGFGAFGGYHENGTVFYLDGRTRKKPGTARISGTTLGIISPAARQSLESVKRTLGEAGLPWTESPDITAWLTYHAALVFPLAGAIYAAGGAQDRVCRTRDALILGIRACKDLFIALKAQGIMVQPRRIGRLVATPEFLLVRILGKALAGEGARVAMFGHANAATGHGEIAGQAAVLDTIARRSGLPVPDWDAILPYLSESAAVPPLPDGARSIRPRLL